MVGVGVPSGTVTFLFSDVEGSTRLWESHGEEMRSALAVHDGIVRGEGELTFREFLMREPVPLATIHEAVLEFLRGRDDAVLYGAQAVNAYVDEPRMTQDVDIASTRAPELVEELRAFLHERFHVAVRVREVQEGLGTASIRCGGQRTGT